MSDRRLRALERASREGDPGAETRLLRGRLRAGEVTHEGLALAAYLGHEPAREALGDPPGARGDLEGWVRRLDAWGKEPLVRAAVAAGRLVLPLWEQRVQGWRRRSIDEADTRRVEDVWAAPERAVTAAEAWLLDPGAARGAQAAADVLLHMGPTEGDPAQDVEGGQVGWSDVADELVAGVFRETHACLFAALTAAEPSLRRVTGHAVQAAVAARERLALEEAPPGPGGEALLRRAAQADRLGHLPELNVPRVAERVRAGIAEALRPWAISRLRGPGRG